MNKHFISIRGSNPKSVIGDESHAKVAESKLITFQLNYPGNYARAKKLLQDENLPFRLVSQVSLYYTIETSVYGYRLLQMNKIRA